MTGTSLPGRPPVEIPPVLVLSSGRCGSTMLSRMLNRHPRILSLSEFFTYVNVDRWCHHARRTGDQMWRLYCVQSRFHREVLGEQTDEMIYPFGKAGARFTLRDVPPIMVTVLPHLTERHEALFEALEPVVRGQPEQPPAEHFRHLFKWLCEQFGADVWVERSGGSAGYGLALLKAFPEARVIHLYRDGREVALSMHKHPPFRKVGQFVRRFESLGVDMMDLLTSDRPAVSTRVRVALAVLVETLCGRRGGRLSHSQFGRLWSLQIEVGMRVFGQLPPDRLLNVRFEDMQGDPEGQIRRLIRFVDPALEDDDWVQTAASIPRPTSSRFAVLGAAEQQAITEACRPGLELLGYSP